MTTSAEHFANIFRIVADIPERIPVTRLSVERRDNRAITKAQRGNAAFELSRRLDTLAAPFEGGVVVIGDRRDLGTMVVQVGVQDLILEPTETSSPTLRDPHWREFLRRLVSDEIKRHIVYVTGRAWYRQQGYYGHRLLRDGQSGLLYSNGVDLEVLSLDDGSLAVAMDRRVVRIGLPLSAKSVAARLAYIEQDPYRRGGLEDGVAKARNYVWRTGEKSKRVYVDAEATRERGGHVLVVRPWRELENTHDARPEDVHPVLASGEAPSYGVGEEFRGVYSPSERWKGILQFSGHLLSDFTVLQQGARLAAEPCPELAAAVRVHPWPALSVGDIRGGVPEERPADEHKAVEHRVRAMQTFGFRHVPQALRRIAVVPLAGEEVIAEELVQVCRASLKAWHLDDRLSASIAPASILAKGADAERVVPVERWLASLSTAERPSAMFVFKENSYRKGRGGEAEGIYKEIHERLGHRQKVPLKMLQTKQPKEGWESSILNNLPGLLARSGAIPWWLHGTELDPALHHDLIVGIDVGGRDRASARGNDRLGAVALSSTEPPRATVFHDTVVGEEVSEALLEASILGAARDLPGPAERHWLVLRDGIVGKGELASLRRVAEKARAGGLLGEQAAFTVAEVRKEHALRLFGGRPGSARQALSGAYLQLRGADPCASDPFTEVILGTTGAPWNSAASADPVRCVIRTLVGPALHAEAVRDIWRLSHLNWASPRTPIKQPLPLHAAQQLCEDLANGRPTYAFPV